MSVSSLQPPEERERLWGLVLAVVCPRCHAQPGRICRKLSGPDAGNPVNGFFEVHTSRFDHAYRNPGLAGNPFA